MEGFDGVVVGVWKKGGIGDVRSDSREKARLKVALHAARAAGSHNCWVGLVGRDEGTGKELSGEKGKVVADWEDG